MPPTKKFQKEEIIDVAYEIVKNEGLDAVNARRIAKELGGSVQPIYHNFSTMEELNKVVLDKIYLKYQETMKKAMDRERPYLAKGLAYIKFAKEYPEFFKIIFMQESTMNIEEFLAADMKTTQNVLETIHKKFKICRKNLKDFHIKVWIFTHGLACLVATRTIQFSDHEIRELLLNTTHEIFRGYKKGERR